MLFPRILAQAIVDPGSFAVPDVAMQAFVVTVKGMLEGGDPLTGRVYQIAAADENTAAREGLERFVSENERPN